MQRILSLTHYGESPVPKIVDMVLKSGAVKPRDL